MRRSLAFLALLLPALASLPQGAAAEGDPVPPAISGNFDRTESGWHNGPVTVTFTCIPGTFDLASCTQPVTVTAQGPDQSVTGEAVDVMGNRVTVTVGGISIDREPPHTGGVIPALPWQTGDVTVTLTVGDNLSGVAATYYRLDGAETRTGTTLTVSAEGTHLLQYWSVDRAGNVEPAQFTSFWIDKTAPDITGAPIRPANKYGWYNRDVTVAFTCFDVGSGLNSCSDDVVLRDEGAGQSATGTAVDNLGHTATYTVTGINIDKTAPVVTLTGNTGYYEVDQTVDIRCTAQDGLSGLAAAACKELLAPAYSLDLGAHNLTATATDKAGNVGSAAAAFTVAVTADSLCRLTTRWASGDGGTANSLCAKLRAAAESDARGNLTSKANQIEAYLHELEIKTDRVFTTEQSAILARLAKAL